MVINKMYSKYDYENLYSQICILTNQQLDIMNLKETTDYDKYHTIIINSIEYIIQNNLFNTDINKIIRNFIEKITGE